MNRARLSEVMTTEVVTVAPEATYKQIVGLMADRRISGLPVVDDKGKMVGVVSEADLLRKPERYDRADAPARVGGVHARSATRKADATEARELMTSPAITVEPTATIAAAARLTAKHHIKRLPVVDGAGRLVGIVSRADLLGIFLRDDDDLRDQILHYVFGRVLWADIKTVDVLVQDGQVSLTGRLERRSEVALAGSLTTSLDGVVGVENHLEYEIDDTEPDFSLRAGDW